MDSSSSDHVAVFMGDDPPHIKPPCSSVQRLRRFTFSKPKSRFVEFSTPIFTQTITRCESEDLLSSRHNKLDSSDSSETEEEDEEEYNKYDEEGFRKGKKKRKINALNKINPRFLVEWLVFIALCAGLVCSLTIPTLKIRLVCGLELWRWALMSLSVLSGRLVSGWVIRVVVFLVEKNCTLRGKVLYFVYGLRRRIRNSVWLGFVLLTWTLAFNAKLRQRSKVVEKAFQALIAALIGFTIWLLKIVAVKVLASSFHVTTYFDRMKESVFHHYVLETLSGPPMGDVAYEEAHRKTWRRKVDIERMKELSMQSKASAWTIKRLASYVRSFGLTTATKAVDESEITSEWEARECSKRIFRNVAKAGVNYIDEEDLMRFLKRVEIHTIFPLFEGALETGKITKSAFRNWVVRAYYERKSLAHSLNDTKRAVQQLHKLASAVVSVIIVVETLTVMNVASTKVIAFMLTQLLLLGFTFQNMCKTVFESVVFVFVMHPFDIGDRCVIDGVQMIVEEMNILTTVFLRQDNEKVYYPNSALITKPISNFYRSPEMCDAVDFTIDASTSKETLIALKKGIQTYIESKPKYWYPKHMVIAKEIDNVSKLKMALCVQHTINHQNYGDRCTRISDLILELRTVFENLGIKYHLLPQEVHLTQVNWRGQLPA